MYRTNIQAFGRFEMHQLEHDSGQSRLAVTPDGCAALLKLTLGGQPLLDAYDNPEAVAGNAWYKNVPLFPFPNRLRDGAYSWQGRRYQFPINDGATDNALHGLSRDFSAEALPAHLGESEAAITCRYLADGKEEAYPFPFTFSTAYRLRGNREFEGVLTFTNTGNSSIPCGFGWHPYFQLEDRIDDLLLQLPACELVGIDRRMLPTGKRYAYDEFSAPSRIGSTVLDNCFALSPEPGRAEVVLTGKTGRLHYWQETGPGKFNFLQVFTHPERGSIALEPVTCNVDAFNTGDGLLILEPGESASASFGLWWEG